MNDTIYAVSVKTKFMTCPKIIAYACGHPYDIEVYYSGNHTVSLEIVEWENIPDGYASAHASHENKIQELAEQTRHLYEQLERKDIMGEPDE